MTTTTITPPTLPHITNDQVDAAIAAWFRITKYDHQEGNDLRKRMRETIAAAVGEEVAEPLYVVRADNDGRIIDAHDRSPDMSTYPRCSLQVIGTTRSTSLREDLAALLARADREGQVVTVELAPVPPLAMGRFTMIGSTRPASGSTLAFREQEGIDAESALELTRAELDQLGAAFLEFGTLPASAGLPQ